MDIRLATLKALLFLFAAKCFNVEFNTESFPVAHLCVNTLPATKVTLITDGI
jgi:hypothetical protein